MVYITGDCHADYRRFSTDNFPDQKDMSKKDLVIICGDFGIWHDTPEERYWLDWVNNKPFTTAFCDGNHENFDRLYGKEFQTVQYHGGRAHKIRDSVYHLMRGYVFTFEKKKFFVFGGAQSHDIQDGILSQENYADKKEMFDDYKKRTKHGEILRINHISWWELELPTENEKERGIRNLNKVGNNVNYVVSHCLPQDVCSAAGYHIPDDLTLYFNKLLQDGLEFDSWYCGHYHNTRRILGKFFINYLNINRIL